MVEEDEMHFLAETLDELHSASSELPKDLKECKKLIQELRLEMFAQAKKREFEQAALLRDRISALEKFMLGFLGEDSSRGRSAPAKGRAR